MALGEEFIMLRQTLRKAIFHMVSKRKNKLSFDRIFRVTKRLQAVEDIGHDIQEVKQAIAILVSQKKIAVDENEDYYTPGVTYKMPKMPKFRSLDDQWES